LRILQIEKSQSQNKIALETTLACYSALEKDSVHKPVQQQWLIFLPRLHKRTGIISASTPANQLRLARPAFTIGRKERWRFRFVPEPDWRAMSGLLTRSG